MIAPIHLKPFMGILLKEVARCPVDIGSATTEVDFIIRQIRSFSRKYPKSCMQSRNNIILYTNEEIIMGRKSTKENKNIYQESRENAALTRDAASEVLGFISADRLVKIENDSSIPHPDEVLAMSKGYKNPSLCNYYCSHECSIGREYIPEVEEKALSQITLEMLSTINTLSKEKDRLIDITLDGKITDDEIPDFLNIKAKLDEMALAIDSLRLWLDNAIANGEIDKEKLDS